MSEALKVGSVCHDPAQLRAGMKVITARSLGTGYVLSDRCASGWKTVSSVVYSDEWIQQYGVIILALPEEAPKPVPEAAAPSLESVPVGSRWRNKSNGIVFTVLGPTSIRVDGESHERFSGGERIPSFATRIDEPAGTGLRFTCSDDNCALPGYHTGPHSMRGVPFTAPAAAMPPARCAPRPFKAHPYCMESHAIESNCVSCEELIAAETNPPPRMELVEVPAEPRLSADQAEARAMRDQRWEAMNASPMVGRYRFDRRPR